MVQVGKMFAAVSAAVFVGLMPSLVRAETCTVNGVTYTYTINNGNATLGSGSDDWDDYWDNAIPTSTTGALTIPSSLNGHPVTSIGDYAFFWCEKLTSVTIPDSVTSIGDYAFYGCTSLTSATILGCVKSIGDDAFRGCTGLTSIVIPDSVKSIGDDAFSGCTGLTSIVIPDSVTSIGAWAFYWCTSLTSVTIPSSVKRIGEAAFYGCRGLKSVSISEGVEEIGSMAFVTGNGCFNLKELVIPASVEQIGYQIMSSVYYLGDNGSYQILKGSVSITFLGAPPKVVDDDGNGMIPVVVYGEGNSTGYYTAAYEKEWKAAMSGGKWYGLKMKKASSTSKKDTDSTSKTDPSTVDLGVFTKARTFNGYVMDGDQYVGSIQIKAAKAKSNKKTGVATSKFTAVVQVLGEKKVSLRGNYDLAEGAIEMAAKGHELSLEMAEDDASSFVGTFDGYDVEVVMDDGTKKTYALDEGAAFYMDTAALSEMLGDDTYADYLPDGIEITTKKTKWVLPKAGKVVYSKKAGGIDESKLGENPSGLKLTFKSKDGTFKGTFKAYVDKKGKPKATTVSVSGFVVDGVGYGIATIKKVGSVPITIE